MRWPKPERPVYFIQEAMSKPIALEHHCVSNQKYASLSLSSFLLSTTTRRARIEKHPHIVIFIFGIICLWVMVTLFTPTVGGSSAAPQLRSSVPQGTYIGTRTPSPSGHLDESRIAEIWWEFAFKSRSGGASPNDAVPISIYFCLVLASNDALTWRFASYMTFRLVPSTKSSLIEASNFVYTFLILNYAYMFDTFTTWFQHEDS